MGVENVDEQGLKKVSIRGLLPAAYSLFIALVILSQSPLCFWNRGESGTDSNVFQTVALMMEKGFMPYRDTFDHKGPLIYLINYFGMKLSPDWGIWLIEVLFMGAAFWAMYKIARLLCGPAASCVVLAVAATPLLNRTILNRMVYYFEYGNLVEEYALPFIAVALYIFLDYLYNDHVNKLRLVVCGICMGGICLLRINMASIWLVFCVFIAVRCVLKKEFADLGRFICYFLIGVCVVVLPILIWLALNKALVPFWNIYIRFNMAYTSGTGGTAGFIEKCRAFKQFFCHDLTFCSFLFTAYAAYTAKAKRQALYCVYAVCLLASTLFATISGYTFPHYGMVLVPLYAFPLAYFLWKCGKGILDAKGRLNYRAAVVLLLAAVTVPYMRTARTNFRWMGSVVHFSNQAVVNEINTVIDVNTAPNEPISVVGNWDYIYVTSGRPHATTYSYQYPIGSVEPAIIGDYLQQLAEELPKLIIISDLYYLPAIEHFLNEYDYTLIYQAPNDSDSSAMVYSSSGTTG